MKKPRLAGNLKWNTKAKNVFTFNQTKYQNQRKQDKNQNKWILLKWYSSNTINYKLGKRYLVTML